MTTLNIDKTKCKKCNQCTYVCPLNILRRKDSTSPEVDAIRLEQCLECGHCVAVCETQAISLNNKNTAGKWIKFADNASFNILSNIVQTRRSIRNYKEDIIPKEDINKLIQLTKWMPTARNMCPVNWTVIHDQKKVNQLSEMVVKLFEENNILPEIVTAWSKGVDIINRGAPHLVLCHTKQDAMMPEIDSAIAMTAFDLSAASMGYGTCWAGFFMMAAKDEPEIAKACGIPEDEEIHAAMMLGVPKFKYKNIPNRAGLDINWQ
ncbi:MAG: nitroreductase family protein [Kiritimatiellae bacterium]|jgi:nitroreductase/Pyruvate/2-oxoacid:ferredoxin oxidoreductase delta subunit|nr:nitroreductase family protein [Kiritimatiellia bacterium]